MGGDDPSLKNDLQQHRQQLEAKQAAMLSDLSTAWNWWDAIIDRTAAGEAISDTDRTAALDSMLSIINRRTYIRNLLREIDEVLES